ncbi:MAG: hypothetical protein M3619_25490, partial [Myxococcota bacterium]|nr:hypothetical protein [Myxococcota bacterium]
ALVITRRAPSPPTASPPTASRNQSPFTVPAAQTPTTINAARPPIEDERAANDWAEIVESLHDHDFSEARERLDEFESRYGQSNETRSLASQLDQLPVEEREPRRKKHKWKR